MAESTLPPCIGTRDACAVPCAYRDLCQFIGEHFVPRVASVPLYEALAALEKRVCTSLERRRRGWRDAVFKVPG